MKQDKVYSKKEYAQRDLRKAAKAGEVKQEDYEVRPVEGGFQIFAKAQPEITLEFAEPGKDKFRYAQGSKGRYAIGPSTRYSSEFALFAKAKDERRFEFIAAFASFAEAPMAAQRSDEESELAPAAVGALN
jgi:hypothetical protein